jgi:ATP phosphoribosyltransferase regulatory subunit
MQISQNRVLPAFLPGEANVLRLRALFEGRGYRKISLPRFEDYSLLLDNKDFLSTGRMVTFMDPAGRLLALRPDVTLSIAKKIPPGELPAAEKLYYTEEVVRFAGDGKTLRATEQIGLEHIGRDDIYSGLETLDLALKSLALLGEETAMDVSHLGFVSAILNTAGLKPKVEKALLMAIRSKNMHELCGILDSAGVENPHREDILALDGLQGPLLRQLQKARGLVRGPLMEEAYHQLKTIGDAVTPGERQNLNLDFSVVGDLNYYNGLVFRGYIKDVAGVALGGGRYDNLMKKLGKKSTAIGFAVYLHRLEGYYAGYHRQWDVLLLYDDNCDWKKLLAKVRELESQGLTVRCEHKDGDHGEIPHIQKIYFKGGGGADA